MNQIIPETSADYDTTRIIERPDGFYWQDKLTDAEYGPFDTLLDAVADMSSGESGGFEKEDDLREAEDEIGIADWIDPDTGAPAEESTPHFEDH